MKKSSDPSQWNEKDWAYHNKKVSEWNEIEWKNVYALYLVVQLHDLDDYFEFDEFKKQMINNVEFASYHKLKPGMESSNYNPNVVTRKSNYYLIKRSNSFRDLKKTNSKQKGYFEITISKDKRNPPSSNLEEKDIIYVAETSGGIYAKGNVAKSGDVDEFSTIEEVLDYSKQFNDDSYWLDKIRLFKKRLLMNPNYKLRCHQYFINQKLLPTTIPYNGSLKKYDASHVRGLASIFFKLKEEDIEYLNNPDYSLKQTNKLDPKIPGDLRLRIHSFFNQNSPIGHLIDIDHFVPKSAGGPGNIIENLVPVGFSLNRYKSNLIPRSFFMIASNSNYISYFKDFEKKIDAVLKIEKQFISEKDFSGIMELARSLNGKIANWTNFEAIRKFYSEVNKSYNPDFVELIQNFE